MSDLKRIDTALCEILGLDPKHVVRLQISAQAGQPICVEAELLYKPSDEVKNGPVQSKA